MCMFRNGDITIYVVTIYHDTSRRYWEANCTRQPLLGGGRFSDF